MGAKHERRRAGNSVCRLDMPQRHVEWGNPGLARFAAESAIDAEKKCQFGPEYFSNGRRERRQNNDEPCNHRQVSRRIHGRGEAPDDELRF